MAFGKIYESKTCTFAGDAINGVTSIGLSLGGSETFYGDGDLYRFC